MMTKHPKQTRWAWEPADLAESWLRNESLLKFSQTKGVICTKWSETRSTRGTTRHIKSPPRQQCGCVHVCMKSSPCFSSPSCNCTAQSVSPPPLTSAAEQHTHAYLCSWASLQIVLSICKWKCPTLLLCEQLFISSQAKPTGGLTVYIRKRETPVVQCILWPRGDFGCIYFSSCLCGEETHIWIADNQASMLNRGLGGVSHTNTHTPLI